MNLKNIFIKNNLKLLVLVSFMVLISCDEKFKEITASELNDKWHESIKHTSVSWWYLGEKGNYHYILEKWPFESMWYTVSSKDVNIKLDNPITYSLDKNNWINLKYKHIEFNEI